MCRALSSRHGPRTSAILGSLTHKFLVRGEHRQVLCCIRDACIASVEVTRWCAERLYHPPSVRIQTALKPRKESRKVP
ncbi:hypothetical protein BDV36DRAFT_266347 [Aspergillus pseudocaelatus]|uniref:Uncharacterized protein n=1 Tax=Aspergillus pseudocaelatus TaxID=1825620 RepID=A0ABQ6WAH1_9EURO|nr:hypothetical protein BDV36DRAFT_266347 [Aspergillus pseudocaelatus]